MEKRPYKERLKAMKLVLALFITFIFINPALAYHAAYDGLLSTHVKQVQKDDILYNGVDYKGWAKDKRHQEAMKSLQAINPENLETKNEKLAFWTNAYNLFTIDLITREEEEDSIKDLGSLISTPWELHEWEISGKSYTLDQIEHEILRKMDEPRIHFALNCASKSCPDLRMESYKADRIVLQFDEQVNIFFENETKGLRTVKGENEVSISKIMDWYEDDFNEGDIKSWVNPYVNYKLKDNTEIDYLDYDWSLNSQ